MISFHSKGKFKKTKIFLDNCKKPIRIDRLKELGVKGVEALRNATPFDTGETAVSWYFKIVEKAGSISIVFCNSNIVDHVPIAIILQYGHATRNGGWVEGIDYINPTIQPLFEELTKAAWKEVTTT